MEKPSITDVFPAVGKPTFTYVSRDDGANERRLINGLNSNGQICVLTGPSKTGKTSLYKQVLPTIKRHELIVRCSGKMTVSDFWASPLETLDFKRLAEVSNSYGISLTAKIGASGEAGWSWLAKAIATVGFDFSAKGDYALKREVVRSSVSSKHLLPLLKQLPLQLIIEDFHYLSEEVKIEVFQQWKAFTDEGVSVLIVSTTHHAADIAKANPDLSGRTRLIDIGKWEIPDLAKIPESGFKLLEIKHTNATAEQIARESVGLPIITQQICQEIATNHDMSQGSEQRSTNVELAEIKAAQKYVAENLYANHKSDYEQLVAGPRQKKRKYATYEKILASFALEPLEFSLSYSDLISRVTSLCTSNESIPAASINAALRALEKFQLRKKMSLLDWHNGEARLYIIEPSFLFYLRQKLDNGTPGADLRERLIQLFEIMERPDGKIEVKMISRPKS